MPLTDEQKTDFDAPYRDWDVMPIAVGKGELIPAGTMVCINATGFAVSGHEATGLTYAGRAEERMDNTNGADGDLSVLVRCNKAVCWRNDGSIVQALLGHTVHVLDNRTVTATDGSTTGANATPATRSKAGSVVLIDTDGVWIK
jgi:hypothetical protein